MRSTILVTIIQSHKTSESVFIFIEYNEKPKKYANYTLSITLFAVFKDFSIIDRNENFTNNNNKNQMHYDFGPSIKVRTNNINIYIHIYMYYCKKWIYIFFFYLKTMIDPNKCFSITIYLSYRYIKVLDIYPGYCIAFLSSNVFN